MSLLTTILGPVMEVIKEFVPDKDLQARLKADLSLKLIELEVTQTKASADIIVAEAKGESWLQRNWRPISMLFFLGLIGSYWVGFAPDYVASNPDVVNTLFDVFKVGLGGYIIGRSGEKIVETIAPAVTAGLKKPAVPR